MSYIKSDLMNYTKSDIMYYSTSDIMNYTKSDLSNYVKSFYQRNARYRACKGNSSQCLLVVIKIKKNSHKQFLK